MASSTWVIKCRVVNFNSYSVFCCGNIYTEVRGFITFGKTGSHHHHPIIRMNSRRFWNCHKMFYRNTVNQSRAWVGTVQQSGFVTARLTEQVSILKALLCIHSPFHLQFFWYSRHSSLELQQFATTVVTKLRIVKNCKSWIPVFKKPAFFTWHLVKFRYYVQSSAITCTHGLDHQIPHLYSIQLGNLLLVPNVTSTLNL